MIIPGRRTLSILIVLGCACTIGAFGSGLSLLKEGASWKTVTGKVANFREINENMILTYSYSLNGGIYRVSENLGSPNRLKPKDLEKYAIGTPIEIAYDPANPNESKIVEGNRFKIGIVTLLAAIVSLIGTGFALYMMKKYHMTKITGGAYNAPLQ